jgi:hypothetical protein
MSDVACMAELGICQGVQRKFGSARCTEVICTTVTPAVIVCARRIVGSASKPRQYFWGCQALPAVLWAFDGGRIWCGQCR